MPIYLPPGIALAARPPDPEFDPLVVTLSPDFYYDFQDASFASGLEDQSGNDYDLDIVSGYLGLTSIAPIRGVTGQAARFTSHNSGNSFKGSLLAAPAALYSTLQSFFVGTDNFCFQLAFRSSNSLGIGMMSVGGMTLGDANDDHRPMSFKWFTTNQLGFYCRIPGQNLTWASTPALNDGDPHILTCCNDQAGTGRYRGYVDGSQIYDVAYQTSDAGYTGGNLRMNVQGNGSYTTQNWDCDHFSAWGDGTTLPTHVQILDMHDKYLAEAAF